MSERASSGSPLDLGERAPTEHSRLGTDGTRHLLQVRSIRIARRRERGSDYATVLAGADVANVQLLFVQTIDLRAILPG